MGIYCAFWFEQYQEDMQARDDLNYYLSRIMTELPTVEPDTDTDVFRLEQMPIEGGGCGFSYAINYSWENGAKYLKVIRDRKLDKYAKSKKTIDTLGVFFETAKVIYQEKNIKFNERVAQLNDEFIDSDKCLNSKEIAKLEKKFEREYTELKIIAKSAHNIGYYARQLLINDGIKPYSNRELDIPQTKFKFKDIRDENPEDLEMKFLARTIFRVPLERKKAWAEATLKDIIEVSPLTPHPTPLMIQENYPWDCSQVDCQRARLPQQG